LNGIYLTNLKLNRRTEAADAFGRVVDYGLSSNKLAVKFLFRVGSRQFLADQTVSANYPVWIKQIAQRAAARNACLEIVGHTSKTGPAQLNERLSLLRAQFVKDRITMQAATLAKRLTTSGVGPRENLIGTGKDNDSDALDRRVEFKVGNKCT